MKTDWTRIILAFMIGRIANVAPTWYFHYKTGKTCIMFLCRTVTGWTGCCWWTQWGVHSVYVGGCSCRDLVLHKWSFFIWLQRCSCLCISLIARVLPDKYRRRFMWVLHCDTLPSVSMFSLCFTLLKNSPFFFLTRLTGPANNRPVSAVNVNELSHRNKKIIRALGELMWKCM